uniref:G_PROTEIN_RECEP_F2_3 domain-containing protein n=1 Tax=Syphacia muris TaxID=451379 RepID=A0A0N5A940_9BILA
MFSIMNCSIRTAQFDTQTECCAPAFDGIEYWPETPANTTVRLVCRIFKDIIYTNERYVYRHCFPNASWEPAVDYSDCIPTEAEISFSAPMVRKLYTILWIGYPLSLFFCLLALCIFCRYSCSLVGWVFPMIPVALAVFVVANDLTSDRSVLSCKLLSASGTLSKAIRALLVLCPLLGINFLLSLYHPLRPKWLNATVHYVSTGGLVAIFFCFRNKEVQDCLGRSFTSLKLSLKLREERKRRGSSRRSEHSQITLLSVPPSPTGQTVT